MTEEWGGKGGREQAWGQEMARELRGTWLWEGVLVWETGTVWKMGLHCRNLLHGMKKGSW